MSDPFDLDNIGREEIASEHPSQPLIPPYFQGLNPPQKQAVETTEGPLLVLAGAGTGKTRVLTTRLAHILATGRGYPGQILAVTFTNRAAQEMKQRVGAIIGEAVESMYWLGTFHAIGVKILRQHAPLLGLEKNFTILDSDDQLRLIKQIVRAEGIDEKTWNPKLLASLIDGWKNRGLTPSQVPAAEAHDYDDGKGINLYAQYQARLKTLNAADFGDLLLHCLTLFQNHPHVLQEYQSRFRYIMVDEYQDTNVAQYLWLRLLAQKHRNICCVGDDDQSIYGWRGAEVGNILRFEKDFEGANIVRLEQNYRSTQHILGASGGLISSNMDRLGKTLWTDKQGGEKVSVNPVWDGREEARNIGEMIEDRQRKLQPLSQIAILVRAGFQTREFEERFLTLDIPHRIVGGFRFYERAEIRDVIAYLRVVANPQDSLAFERIINVPKRGLGDVTLKKIHALSRAENCSLPKAARMMVETDELRGKARGSLTRLLDDFDHWRDLSKEGEHLELTENILEQSGYSDMWRQDKSPEAEGKLENLSELLRAMEAFEGLDEFLEHISLVMENAHNDAQEKVNIMTLHGAKGLEFETVFLPGWEEELFPSKKSLEEQGGKGLEEERRLAYVGITRAKKEAHIFHASSRFLYGKYTSPQPSRFLAELPAEHVEINSPQAMYGQATPQNNSDSFSGKTPHWASGYNSKYEAKGPRHQLDRSRARGNSSTPSHKKSNSQSSSAYKVGDRVFHDKFGYGNVLSLDGNKLEIDFEKASIKKVMDSFVRAA